jgi:hypothetical protein
VTIKKYMADFTKKAGREPCVPGHVGVKSAFFAWFGEQAVAEFSRM